MSDISLIKPLRSIRTQRIFREIRKKKQRVLIYEEEISGTKCRTVIYEDE